MDSIKKYDYAKNPSNLQQEDDENNDNILNQLKLIKFEGINAKNMSIDEVHKEMTKLINESKSNIINNNENKSNLKSNRSAHLSGNNIIYDYGYPFKQDKLSCNIL